MHLQPLLLFVATVTVAKHSANVITVDRNKSDSPLWLRGRFPAHPAHHAER